MMFHIKPSAERGHELTSSISTGVRAEMAAIAVAKTSFEPVFTKEITCYRTKQVKKGLRTRNVRESVLARVDYRFDRPFIKGAVFDSKTGVILLDVEPLYRIVESCGQVALPEGFTWSHCPGETIRLSSAAVKLKTHVAWIPAPAHACVALGLMSGVLPEPFVWVTSDEASLIRQSDVL